MENKLPSIRDMYNCQRDNYDPFVIRRHQSLNQIKENKRLPTKKGHYLNDMIKMISSPGPANQSNLQSIWAVPSKVQQKRSQRMTYIEEIQRKQKRIGNPSPDHYGEIVTTSNKSEASKNYEMKINFTNHSQYQSIKTPGPGNYEIARNIGCKVNCNKIIPHNPLKINQTIAADMNTYSPCSVSYNTFMKTELLSKLNIFKQNKKSPNKNPAKNKENVFPGPGTYQIINSWKNKKNFNKNQHNFLNHITKGPSLGIYH